MNSLQFSFLVALTTLILSCKSNTSPDSLIDPDKADKARTERQAELESDQTLSQLTSLRFDKLMTDFGKVKAGDTKQTDFIVTNTGDKPLVIIDVSSSCGCTIPERPTSPILPGEEGIIKVSFKPSGNNQEVAKRVTVKANTQERTHVLSVKAFVTNTN